MTWRRGLAATGRPARLTVPRLSMASVSSGSSLYSPGLTLCESTRLRSDFKIRADTGLLAFIGFSHAENVADCFPWCVADHDEAPIDKRGHLYQYLVHVKEGAMARNTSVSLGDHFEQFISGQVDSGRYGSASEVVRAGLRLLETTESKLEVLRNSLIAGERSGRAKYSYESLVAELDSEQQ